MIFSKTKMYLIYIIGMFLGYQTSKFIFENFKNTKIKNLKYINQKSNQKIFIYILNFTENDIDWEAAISKTWSVGFEENIFFFPSLFFPAINFNKLDKNANWYVFSDYTTYIHLEKLYENLQNIQYFSKKPLIFTSYSGNITPIIFNLAALNSFEINGIFSLEQLKIYLKEERDHRNSIVFHPKFDYINVIIL